ncbi:carboxymuconolactone decarboxylase family protein [Nocardia sp. NPDC020380]|uniref:carboxymuconolactone decarboxylase family protein n=1 Tax=Nocardia sp. NPDC020380 TaxID=3364309 RepID=UPI0037A263C2
MPARGAVARCAYCIDTHVRGAAAAGATRVEIAEACAVAAAVCAGGATAHGLLALRLHDEATAAER